MITLVNYGSGNIKAITNVFHQLNIDVIIVDTPSMLKKATKLILPGVGAFDDSINRLNRSGLRETLDKLVLDFQVPVLGVCVGMQMMASKSEEGSEGGLSWFHNSKVVRFDISTLPYKPKLPHMGWNTIKQIKSHPIFNNLVENKGFYFLHSYHFSCEECQKLAVTKYGVEFTSAIHKDNIFGFQFHPEKSHSNGVTLLKNFAGLKQC